MPEAGNSSALSSKARKTMDDDPWVYTGPPEKVYSGRSGGMRRQGMKKSIWDIPAKTTERQSVEDFEGSGSFARPSSRKIPVKTVWSGGKDSISKLPAVEKEGVEDYWSIPSIKGDSAERTSKTEDVICGEQQLQAGDVVGGGESSRLPTTQTRCVVSLHPKSSITTPQVYPALDSMKLGAPETSWSFQKIQAILTAVSGRMFRTSIPDIHTSNQIAVPQVNFQAIGLTHSQQTPPIPPANTTAQSGSSTTTAPFSLLLSLPTELQLSITELLPTETILALRTTCNYLHTIIPTPTLSSLLALEHTPWARARPLPLWTCSICLRLRPTPSFADTMVRGARGLNGKEPHKRFCVACGIHTSPATHASRYAPGSEIIVGGVTHVFCRACRGYKRELGGKDTGVCRGCHGILRLGGVARGLEPVVPAGMGTRARKTWRRRREGGCRNPYGYESGEDELPEGMVRIFGRVMIRQIGDPYGYESGEDELPEGYDEDF
ncbi:hypothetical protein BU16DRAFT_386594 [Lophium mytilinum]|uniref:F-box domain-containing protein n=1 Tax=Lophium mytilinum TaxID=390894 RepID=A0A6A6QUB5_9PEZI|nr:hypothetical protein BU16DRAFT_386594 [Lophium mytilinum]